MPFMLSAFSPLEFVMLLKSKPLVPSVEKSRKFPLPNWSGLSGVCSTVELPPPEVTVIFPSVMLSAVSAWIASLPLVIFMVPPVILM